MTIAVLGYYLVMKILYSIVASFLLLVSCRYDSHKVPSIAAELLGLSDQQNPVQTFEISPRSDTLITGIHGTKVYIKANSLLFEDGEPVASPVILHLKEVYSLSDMILNGLSTTSDGGLLQTSGMIHLTASSHGKEVELDPKRPVKIHFNKITEAHPMRTYLGKKDSMVIDWELDTANRADTLYFSTSERSTVTLGYTQDTTVIDSLIYGIVARDTFLTGRVRSAPPVPGDFYELHTTKLGWINCDFFIFSKDNLDLFIEGTDPSTTRNYLVFKNYRSIMPGWVTEAGKIMFQNIPIDSEVIVFSIKKIGKDYFLASKALMANKNQLSINLKYQASSLAKIQKELKKIEKGI